LGSPIQTALILERCFAICIKPFGSFECSFFKNSYFCNFHEFTTLTIIVFQYVINFFILDSTI